MDIEGSRSGSHRRPADIWLYALQGAKTERELVVAARDFIATWSPIEVSRLPGGWTLRTLVPGRAGG